MTHDPAHDWGAYQLLTSPGPAAIAVVRVRGPLTELLLRRHLRLRADADPTTWRPGRVFRAQLLALGGEVIDDLVLSVHARGPEWDIRLHLHGSPGVVRGCSGLLEQLGLSHRSELAPSLWHTENEIEAEAHALLPRMLTLDGVRWLVRQGRVLPEALRIIAGTSDVATRQRACRAIVARHTVFDWFARPLRVALVGPPNAGKSTLANALADRHVSLVSPIPGTTRDWIEAPGEIDGFPVLWLDTAGLRRGGGEIEAEGIRRTRHLMESADAIVLVLDARAEAAAARAEFVAAHEGLRPTCIALNKDDLVEQNTDPRGGLPDRWRDRALTVSAARSTGLDRLAKMLRDRVGYASDDLAAPAAFTARQIAALEHAIAGGNEGFGPRVLACL